MQSHCAMCRAVWLTGKLRVKTRVQAREVTVRRTAWVVCRHGDGMVESFREGDRECGPAAFGLVRWRALRPPVADRRPWRVLRSRRGPGRSASGRLRHGPTRRRWQPSTAHQARPAASLARARRSGAFALDAGWASIQTGTGHSAEAVPQRRLMAYPQSWLRDVKDNQRRLLDGVPESTRFHQSVRERGRCSDMILGTFVAP